MANPLRGEVDLKVGEGEGVKTYTLRFSINTMVTVEDVMGTGLADVIEELQGKPKIGTLRALLWAGLQEHHKGLSLFDAGDMIGAVGLQKAAEVIGEAMGKAFPAGDGANPSPDAT